MSNFDLKELLNNRSIKENNVQTEEYKTDGVVELVNIYDMIPSQDNFYSVNEIMDLVNSIKLVGILQPLLLSESEEVNKFSIKAGHRRQRALIYLVEQEGLSEYRYAPAIIKPEQDNILGRLTIIMANRFREKSDWEKMQEVIQTEELIRELNGNKNINSRTRKELKKLLGVNSEKNMGTRDFVAEILSISSTQVGRYKTIYNNLCLEMMKLFKESQINVSVAAEVAALTPDWQMKAFLILTEKGFLQIGDIRDLKQQEEKNKPVLGQIKFIDIVQSENESTDTIEKMNQAENVTEKEMETFEAKPEYKDILCYGCLHYAECDKKAGTVFKCDSYENKAEAEKTQEQIYNEEQEKIDRKTAKKLEEMRQSEVKNKTLSDNVERPTGNEFEITVTMRQFAEIYYGHIDFMVTLKKDYKIDDEISIKEYSRGVATGKEMTVRVKNILKDCTGIEDAYCVIGF